MPDQLKTVVTNLRKGYEHIIRQQPEEAAQAFGDFCAAHIEAVIDGLNQQNPSQ